jgi:hypothetical protein
MSEFKIDYKSMINEMGIYWIIIESHKLNFLSWLLQNANTQQVQEIYLHTDRNLGICENDYFLWCWDLWMRATQYHPDDGHVKTYLVRFVSDMVVLVCDSNLKAQVQRIRDEITKKQNELDSLKTQLDKMEDSNQA